MGAESNWECNVCEACGVCSGSQKECDTYHEYYGMEGGTSKFKTESHFECNVCEACGVCSGSQKECDTYHEFYGMEVAKDVKVQLADGPTVAIPHHEMMNKGIINRLTGRIVNVIEGDVMAQLTIEIGADNYISSMIPIAKYLEYVKNKGDQVTAVFNAVHVEIMR